MLLNRINNGFLLLAFDMNGICEIDFFKCPCNFSKALLIDVKLSLQILVPSSVELLSFSIVFKKFGRTLNVQRAQLRL